MGKAGTKWTISCVKKRCKHVEEEVVIEKMWKKKGGRNKKMVWCNDGVQCTKLVQYTPVVDEPVVDMYSHAPVQARNGMRNKFDSNLPLAFLNGKALP